jgi:hypothetical protein
MNFFDQKFKSAILDDKSIDSVHYMDKNSASSLLERNLIINGDDNMKILLPEDNVRIENDSVHADYILFIDKLSVSRPSELKSGMMMNGHMTGGYYSESLYHSIHFAFWDNMKGKLITYGWVEDKSDLFFLTMTKSNWESVIAGLTKKILRSSPFRIRDYFHPNLQSVN